MIKKDRGTWFSVTASGTSTATVTQAATANQLFYITDVGASTNSGVGTAIVVGGSLGATVLWQQWIGGSTLPWEKTFSTPLVGTPGASVGASVTTTNGTLCFVSISGFIINTT